MRFLWLKPRKCRSVSAILYQYSWIMFSIHCIRNACPFTSHVQKLTHHHADGIKDCCHCMLLDQEETRQIPGVNFETETFIEQKGRTSQFLLLLWLAVNTDVRKPFFFFFMRMESKTVPKACSSIKSMEIVKFRVWSVETETFIKQRGSCKTSRFLPILWLAVNDDVRKPLTKNSTSSLFQSF